MLFFSKKTKIKYDFDWLIVGLGNPEKKYLANRHNIGWTITTEFNKKYNGEFSLKSKYYYHSYIKIEKKNLFLALPTTYMNNSGLAVSKITKEFNISPEKIVVIVDDYNFPLGKIHLKSGGSSGGHNGIASIIEHINTSDFFRLRCGIGKNFASGEMADYVLSDFSENEIDERNSMINKGIIAIETLVRLDPPRAMSLINSGELWLNQMS